MKDDGQKPLGVKYLDDKNFNKELVSKLIEESTEMLVCKNKEDLAEELADIFEIANYLKRSINISDNNLKLLIKKKREKNGGFDKRIYLDKVGTPKDSKWLKYYLANSDRYPEVKVK